jgi:hydroxymethylbilane synthase
MKKLCVGSRQSKLALVQTEIVIKTLKKQHNECEFEIVSMKTKGDLILDRPLEGAGGKGLFIEEIDRAILDGGLDFAVHSLKDIPSELTPGTVLAAFCKRLDNRDALVLNKALTPETFMHDTTKPIGCSGKRRALQLKRLYPEKSVALIRGNVNTRLEKLDKGDYSALVLAAAGLKRLGLEGRISKYFGPEELLSAAGQGITCVVCAAERPELRSMLASLNDKDTEYCALAERAFVKSLGGGCGAPVAAWAHKNAGLKHQVAPETQTSLTLEGWFINENGERRGSNTGPESEAETLGTRLAQELKQ